MQMQNVNLTTNGVTASPSYVLHIALLPTVASQNQFRLTKQSPHIISTTTMMFSKTSTILRTVSVHRAAFSTATCGRPMQKLFIEYLDEAQQHRGRRTNTTSNIPKPAKNQQLEEKSERKMQKIPIDYLNEAMAKIAARKAAQAQA